MTVEALAQEIYDQLPQAMKEQAESVRAYAERERWLCGDQSADLIDELHPRYPKTSIRIALSKLYHCTEGTVKDREYVARRITPQLRNAYPPITYHYWRACAQSGQPIEYAEQIMGHLEAYGQLPTVSQVYGWVNSDGDIRPVWALRLDKMLDYAAKVERDERTPEGVRPIMRLIPELLGYFFLSKEE